ncbi:MAG TPA: PTS sugar transporter subunit IIA [Anaerohalosphaeraceae bacterium]|nr:PTS sugar transporter subunit IIA [Anaerohalosphaeraceae bacterium]HOL32824.1 PTS sugar transporter subunit IIA [Anaerohalosphaeraceae bacterium]HOM77531.1 PTS sugar transporter subunit IIA [Anaerohalosphaeraceae bacterium]HPC64856.1 PTS sugar transporter subunit IIA [Anaerohalosphaeraceae bacterium]HPO71078.1 PTS sugar transporter subunit IIA [Anaerohalosphaeraceae bacterium]
MLLTQILQPVCIKAPLAGKTKEDAIEELVNLLADHGYLTDRADAFEAVMAREHTRSTGIGSGIAIPHGKCSAAKELVMAVGIAAEPIDFNSIDGKPVTIILLLVSPPDQTGPRIQALARISRLMLDAQFKAQLEKAASPEEVYSLISSKESE